MTWYKNKIAKYVKENYHPVIFFFVFMLVCLLWYRFSGQKFTWKEVEWVSAPPIWERIIYSCLVYETLGKWLYEVYFYKFLHFVCVGLFDNWKLYKEIKSNIWLFLILIMYFYIIPMIVNLLNFTISFFYNLTGIILYIAPPIGIFMISYSVYAFIKSETLRNKAMQEEIIEKVCFNEI